MENNSLIGNINATYEKLFSSVQRDVFKAIDSICVIDEEVIKEEPLSNLLNIDGVNYMAAIASSFIVIFCLYYVVTNFICMYNGSKSQHMPKVILRIIVVGVLANFSIVIVSFILEINNIFTTSLNEIGSYISKDSLTFECLKDKIIDINEFMKEDALSLNGIIKGILSFGGVSLFMTFAIRYVTIIFLILISPLAFICLCSKMTSGIFVSYIKLFIVNIMIQNVVKLVLMIPLSCINTKALTYKIIMIGSVYIIYKINTFTKEIFSKISLR